MCADLYWFRDNLLVLAFASSQNNSTLPLVCEHATRLIAAQGHAQYFFITKGAALLSRFLSFKRNQMCALLKHFICAPFYCEHIVALFAEMMKMEYLQFISQIAIL